MECCVTWRGGTKGRLAARFAAIRIRVAAKPEVCAGDGAVWGNNRHLPGNEAWLIGERKYYLANLPSRTSVRALAAAIKARWVCEQAYPQLKGELGLGHFEGRSWTGLHRHALMTCIAYAYLTATPVNRRHPHPCEGGQDWTLIGGQLPTPIDR